MRACFRLDEPDEEDDEHRWRLVLGLQASDSQAWSSTRSEVWRGGDALARHVADPQEALLGELGRAVRLFPDLTRALRTARPAELLLDTGEAHTFLSDTAPLLLASGFGVLLPGWWGRPQARLGARLRASTPGQPGATAGVSGIGQQGLVDVRWELLVGDEGLTDEEVEELAAAGQRLVRVRGRWMQVDPERLAKARAFLRRRRPGPMSLVDVLKVLSAEDAGPGGLPVVDVQADGWLGDLLSGQAEQRIEPVDAPEGFGGTLRPYQERGLAWLTFLEQVGVGGVLADDMGLGKTVQLLALIGRSGRTPDAARLPDVAGRQLAAGGRRFTPDLRVHVHHGAERPRGTAFAEAVASCDLLVTTYALLARDAEALAEVPWHRVVLDEAQAVKNAATKAAQAARTLQTPGASR